jgi:phosphohistidine phosphatase
MDLYLVRHAEAADKAVDPARNLTERGRRDAAALAEALRPLRLRVRAIWHSGKPRAVQTADAIAPAVTCDGDPLVRHSGLKPFDPVKRLARTLNCTDGGGIMIVGHEPFLGRLAARLVTGHAKTLLLALDKPGVAYLRRDESGDWRVIWMLAPPLITPPVPDDEPVATDATTAAAAEEPDLSGNVSGQ